MFLSLLDAEAPVVEAAPMGYAIGIIGIAICVLLCGIGSAIGLYKTGSAASGVLGEEDRKSACVGASSRNAGYLRLHNRYYCFRLARKRNGGSRGLGSFRCGSAYGFFGLGYGYIPGQVRGKLYLRGRQAGVARR